MWFQTDSIMLKSGLWRGQTICCRTTCSLLWMNLALCLGLTWGTAGRVMYQYVTVSRMNRINQEKSIIDECYLSKYGHGTWKKGRLSHCWTTHSSTDGMSTDKYRKQYTNISIQQVWLYYRLLCLTVELTKNKKWPLKACLTETLCIALGSWFCWWWTGVAHVVILGFHLVV